MSSGVPSQGSKLFSASVILLLLLTSFTPIVYAQDLSAAEKTTTGPAYAITYRFASKSTFEIKIVSSQMGDVDEKIYGFKGGFGRLAMRILGAEVSGAEKKMAFDALLTQQREFFYENFMQHALQELAFESEFLSSMAAVSSETFFTKDVKAGGAKVQKQLYTDWLSKVESTARCLQDGSTLTFQDKEGRTRESYLCNGFSGKTTGSEVDDLLLAGGPVIKVLEEELRQETFFSDAEFADELVKQAKLFEANGYYGLSLDVYARIKLKYVGGDNEDSKFLQRAMSTTPDQLKNLQVLSKCLHESERKGYSIGDLNTITSQDLREDDRAYDPDAPYDAQQRARELEELQRNKNKVFAKLDCLNNNIDNYFRLGIVLREDAVIATAHKEFTKRSSKTNPKDYSLKELVNYVDDYVAFVNALGKRKLELTVKPKTFVELESDSIKEFVASTNRFADLLQQSSGPAAEKIFAQALASGGARQEKLATDSALLADAQMISLISSHSDAFDSRTSWEWWENNFIMPVSKCAVDFGKSVTDVGSTEGKWMFGSVIGLIILGGMTVGGVPLAGATAVGSAILMGGLALGGVHGLANQWEALRTLESKQLGVWSPNQVSAVCGVMLQVGFAAIPLVRAKAALARRAAALEGKPALETVKGKSAFERLMGWRPSVAFAGLSPAKLAGSLEALYASMQKRFSKINVALRLASPALADEMGQISVKQLKPGYPTWAEVKQMLANSLQTMHRTAAEYYGYKVVEGKLVRETLYLYSGVDPVGAAKGVGAGVKNFFTELGSYEDVQGAQTAIFKPLVKGLMGLGFFFAGVLGVWCGAGLFSTAIKWVSVPLSWLAPGAAGKFAVWGLGGVAVTLGYVFSIAALVGGPIIVVKSGQTLVKNIGSYGNPFEAFDAHSTEFKQLLSDTGKASKFLNEKVKPLAKKIDKEYPAQVRQARAAMAAVADEGTAIPATLAEAVAAVDARLVRHGLSRGERAEASADALMEEISLLNLYVSQVSSRVTYNPLTQLHGPIAVVVFPFAKIAQFWVWAKSKFKGKTKPLAPLVTKVANAQKQLPPTPRKKLTTLQKAVIAAFVGLAITGGLIWWLVVKHNEAYPPATLPSVTAPAASSSPAAPPAEPELEDGSSEPSKSAAKPEVSGTPSATGTSDDTSIDSEKAVESDTATKEEPKSEEKASDTTTTKEEKTPTPAPSDNSDLEPEGFMLPADLVAEFDSITAELPSNEDGFVLSMEIAALKQFFYENPKAVAVWRKLKAQEAA